MPPCLSQFRAGSSLSEGDLVDGASLPSPSSGCGSALISFEFASCKGSFGQHRPGRVLGTPKLNQVFSSFDPLQNVVIFYSSIIICAQTRRLSRLTQNFHFDWFHALNSRVVPLRRKGSKSVPFPLLPDERKLRGVPCAVCFQLDNTLYGTCCRHSVLKDLKGLFNHQLDNSRILSNSSNIRKYLTNDELKRISHVIKGTKVLRMRQSS